MPTPARMLLVMLASRQNTKTGRVFPSQERISKDTGIGITAIDDHTKSLIDRKWMTREKYGHNQYRYFLTPEDGQWWDVDVKALASHRVPPVRVTDGGTLDPRMAGL